MSSVWDVPGLARAVDGPVGAAAPAGAAVNTFWPVSKRSTRPKSRLATLNKRSTSFASRRWRDRCLAAAELRRRSGELTALRRRDTRQTRTADLNHYYTFFLHCLTNLRSSPSPLHSALCTNPAYLCTQAIVNGGPPNESSAPHRSRSRPGRPRPGCTPSGNQLRHYDEISGFCP